MLGVLCKYAPVELFEAMGAETEKITPNVSDYTQAELSLHTNMCSYIKSVLEETLRRDYEGIVLTTCCDSTRRLYDALKHHFPKKFIYLLDLPHKVNDFAAGLYTDQLIRMLDTYAAHCGRQPDYQKLAAALMPPVPGTPHERSMQNADSTGGQNRLRIGLMGARVSPTIYRMLEESNVSLAFDMTCTGLERDVRIPGTVFPNGVPANPTDVQKRTLLDAYASALLNQLPCMRMMRATGRRNFVASFSDRTDGIIYHTIKFCDIYAYEYVAMKQDIQTPLLAIETDATNQCSGQLCTRMEAFLESLSPKAVTEPRKETTVSLKGTSAMYSLGIDSGSTSTNAVLLDTNKEIAAFHVIRTGAKSGDSAKRIYEEILAKAGITKEQLCAVVSTGYGRISIPFANSNITEISCHAKGAHYLNPSVRTILDIGGQDSKAIHINEKGEVIDFVMNDKCAAGTGRFLEMMARTLELDLKQLGPVSLRSKENIEINSMCSVFAESEVISLIAQNKEKSDIAHGIHNAIANRSLALLHRIQVEPGIMMTGGVAKNPGVVRALEDALGETLFLYEEPEIVGAIGAALYGLEQ